MQKRRGLINFLIVMTLLVVFIVGCSVLLRSGGGEAITDEGTVAGGGNGAEAATMTFDQFESIQLETTRDQLTEEYGTPTPREELIAQGIISDDPTTQNCLYYKADPPTFGEWFEFCFEGDSLVTKTSL